MSFYQTNNRREQTTSGLNGQFVRSQLLIDCLLRMPPTLSDKAEFVALCSDKYHDDPKKLEIVHQLAETYSSDRSIWWYTRETFLYGLLNRSLRIQDIDCLFQLRFLIRDIAEQLTRHRSMESMRLFRGQVISEEELLILRQLKGELISMNSFFSTSTSRQVAYMYIDASNSSHRVLFDIDARPCENQGNVFANITSLSAFEDEEEVLMMLGSIFRLNDVYVDQDQIWIVKMTLCDQQDVGLQSVFDHMRNQYGSGETRLLHFGHTLIDMAQFDQAEKYYVRLMKDLPKDHRDLYICYQALGKIACEKGEYRHSLKCLKKSLIKVEEIYPKTHSRCAFIHTNIGEVYQRMMKHKLALRSHETALNIWSNISPINYEYLAWCFNNIAIISLAQNQYQTALHYYAQAIQIKRNLLPPKHPCIANTYLNIGNVYYHLCLFDQAWYFYNLSLDVYQASLLPEHPSMAAVMKNIGIIYEIYGDYENALKKYRQAFSIRKETFHSSHPDSQQLEGDIRRVLLKIKFAN